MGKVKVQLKYLNVKPFAQSHHNKTGVMSIKMMIKPHNKDIKIESAV